MHKCIILISHRVILRVTLKYFISLEIVIQSLKYVLQMSGVKAFVPFFDVY